MSTSVNGATSAKALVLPLGIILIFSMSTAIAMFITSLSSDKIAHVHVYATTLLFVFFWIKPNIKMFKFLTLIIGVLLAVSESEVS